MMIYKTTKFVFVVAAATDLFFLAISFASRKFCVRWDIIFADSVWY